MRSAALSGQICGQLSYLLSVLVFPFVQRLLVDVPQGQQLADFFLFPIDPMLFRTGIRSYGILARCYPISVA
jgi:hypothetical protein